MKKNSFILFLIIFNLSCLLSQEKDDNFFLIEQNSGSNASFRGLAILNEKVAWVSGAKGTALTTNDGGVNWNPIKVEGADKLDFRDIEIIDKNNIILLPAGNTGKIFRTSNGGKDWKIVYNNEAPGVFFDGMAFKDKNTGYIFSDPVKNNFLILSTRDGGRTWKEIDTNLLPKPLPGEAAFAASGTSVCAKGNNIWIGLGGAEKTRILKSGDDGKTWKIINTPLASGASTKGIFSVAFWDNRNGIIVGGDYAKPEKTDSNAAITSDGGDTWLLVNGIKGYKSCVTFYTDESKNILLTAGTSGYDISYDGGKSWRYLGSRSLNTVSVRKNAGWAVGDKGTIVKINIEQMLNPKGKKGIK